MRHNTRLFIESVEQTFRLGGPVYEFGSYLVTGQEEIANLRGLFRDREYVGCDLREGRGVDRLEDISDMTLPDESAGTVICIDTLEHVFEARRAVDEMLRILAPGGTILLTVPMDFHIHHYPDDYWRFTPACMARLLADLPATVIGSQGEERYPHTVFALGCKAPVPQGFAASAQRMMREFPRCLARLAARERASRRWKRQLRQLLLSKGERRRTGEHHLSRFAVRVPVACSHVTVRDDGS